MISSVSASSVGAPRVSSRKPPFRSPTSIAGVSRLRSGSTSRRRAALFPALVGKVVIAGRVLERTGSRPGTPPPSGNYGRPRPRRKPSCLPVRSSPPCAGAPS
eukprot:6311830-Heterocapsa_arctica.AAC.1